MRNTLLLLTVLFAAFGVLGQCPNERIDLQSQADIDNFATNYPNCTEFGNALYIGGTDITNLEGLSQLTSITGGLTIARTNAPNLMGLHNITYIENLEVYDSNFQDFEGLNSLTGIGNLQVSLSESIINFQGLENLESIEHLNLFNNFALQNFEGLASLTSLDFLALTDNINLRNFQGLEGVTTITGSIRIESCPNLESFNGLENLETIEDKFYIYDAPSLQGFEALQSIAHIGQNLWVLYCDQVENLDAFYRIENLDYSFQLVGNYNLRDISGLSNLSGNYRFGIRILDNPILSECSIKTVCENIYVSDLSYFEIANNGPGCTTVEEITEACGAVNIPDSNFLQALIAPALGIDTNIDGLIQYSEAGVFTGMIDVPNKNIIDFTGIEAFPNITGLNIKGNPTQQLYLARNRELDILNFGNSPNLEFINLKNDRNNSIDEFRGVNCPNLQWICVEDASYAQANFTNIDPHVQFVEDCEILSTQSFDLRSAITLTPNPVLHMLTISADTSIEISSVDIFSIAGQKLIQSENKEIDLSELSVGVYFVKVSTNRGLLTKKIVKQ